MTKTEENLKAAFAGESQANRTYLDFAKAANKEGLPQIAKLFRAAAEAETIHAHNHLNVLGKVKSTEENLEAAISGETYEFQNMYPQMIEDAKAEDNKNAIRTFNYANEVEKVHADLYKQALEAAKTKKDMAAAEIYVCPICGDTFVGEAPDKCPVCGMPKARFTKIA